MMKQAVTAITGGLQLELNEAKSNIKVTVSAGIHYNEKVSILEEGLNAYMKF